MNGGDLVARVLEREGARFLFTLCGGHISPILVAAKRRGIRVIDCRHEATAVFAADAVARLTGTPGLVAVTAGPGLTNTITAVKNAQLAESPLVLLGGATATVLKGRGALQDIDQMALLRPHVKRAWPVKRVRDLAPAVAEAFHVARTGIPGPVFVECPVDLLYDEAVVREWYGAKSGAAQAKSLAERATRWYLSRHVRRLFAGADDAGLPPPRPVTAMAPAPAAVAGAADLLARAQRPVLLVGSQALLAPGEADALARAVTALGVPSYLSGMARGLLGAAHPLQLRHRRKEALREADLVILAGTPIDFRLDYGRHIGRHARLVTANRSRAQLRRNRRPDLAVHAAPELFLRSLAGAVHTDGERYARWLGALRERDAAREREIAEQAAAPSGGVNPLRLVRAIDAALPEASVVVADGGDFVATASYVVRPRGPLSWLDPGAFGTLGVGAGFAIGAALARPGAEVWILYGDGSLGYSLIEMDTFARHGLPVIAVVGNDASWAQIARDQVELLKDDVGTVLAPTAYHEAARGLGAEGFLLEGDAEIETVLRAARAAAGRGRPVLVNARLARSEFRKGSLSM
jgi:thiamine pyrophosphate-dependent acetolactate synthase large subunit-like protein